MADIFDELLEFWRAHKVDPADAKATFDDIREWEIANHVCLPDDLREYVLRVNGIRGGEELKFEHESLSFLPLKAMVPEKTWSSEYDGKDMFIFADMLINSYWWCAQLSGTSARQTAIFVRGRDLVLVADSLEEFLRAYMTGATRIHPR
jgi:hypothetical protein